MALFATGAAAQSTVLPTAGTTATLVWNPNSTSLQATGVTGNTLKDVTIVNAGANLVWLGQSTVTISTGVPLPAGGQLTIQGSTFTAGNAAGAIYGICGAGTSTTVLSDLASLASVA